MTKILVINGPNISRIGRREPKLYGNTSFDTLKSQVVKHGNTIGFHVECFNSNHEGDLINALHAADDDPDVKAVIINPGAYSHTSIALLDAIRAIQVPVIEVHLSNIYARENFRRHSFVSEAAIGVIAGLGINGYLRALDYLYVLINRDEDD